ncbi:MAG: DUF378 domain-containing protein [Alphaproteobacteria bacterium]
MEIIKRIAYVLTIIGGLNWGLVGLFEFDAVMFIFGPMTTLASIIYILVGISAVIVACTGCSALCKCKNPEDKQI